MKWQKINRFVEISSPWVKLFGEKYKDHRGEIIDYWRIEKIIQLLH